jgi:tetratricopeptide (TPR) repeat protein
VFCERIKFMKFAGLALKILFFSTLLAAFSLPAAAKDDWLRVQTTNFQLVGSADEKDLRRVATKLEQFRLVFTQLFPNMNFNSPLPTRVVVFRDKKTFDAFKPIEWAAGYFQPGDDINYIVLTAEGSDAENFPTVFHEYTHFLIDNSLGRSNIPPWFNEGIAEYYERFAIEDDRKVTLGAVNDAHLRLLQRSQLIPLENFFAVDYYSLHKQTKQGAQLFYAESWALLHYLLQGNGGARRPQFDKFVDLLIGGARPKEAFQNAFQMDYAAMEAELKKYVAQKNFSETVVPFKEKLVFDSQTQSFPLSEADAKAFQGDLLFHTHRLDEAEKMLSEALALNANSSLANTSLGLVKLQQKKFSEAKKLLEKGIRADTENYLAFFSYAYAMSRENLTDFGFSPGYSAADAEKMRETLRHAISLNPNYGESYNLYAFVNIVRNEELAESIELIKKALKIAPGNQWYGLRLAELYMRTENFAAARPIAQKIVQTASDDRLKVYAENTLRTINSLEAQLEDIKNHKKHEDDEAVSETPLSDEEIARRREKAILESLNATLRRPRANEKRLLGYVTKIECQPAQIIFSVKSGEQSFELRSASLETLTLVSFAAGIVNSEFGCGVVKKENLSVITFRPSADADAKIAGEIVAVEFVPQTFRFLSENK